MKKRICSILCILTLLGFTMIFVQEQWRPFQLKPLNGFTPATAFPTFNLKNFASGKYQDTLEQYSSENFGFREWAIRLYNQAAYSCFNKITNDNVVEGLNHELYLKMYLDDAMGHLLWGAYPDVETAKAAARENVEETLRLIDTLRQHDITFLFVFAPSKTKVYPEWMPEQCHTFDFSLQEYYIELFKEYNIPHIDFLNYFRSIKDTAAYPLYTRMGTHWAASTIPWVGDSILRKIEDLTQYNLPSQLVVDTNITTDYYIMDNELERQMNLMFPLPKPAVPNPTFVYTDTIDADRPGLLIIGDSYSNQLVYSGFGKAFDHWDLWIYNKDIQSSRENYSWTEVKKQLDAATMLQEADVVLAVFTAPMYYDYMFGFPETIQNIYQTGFVDEEEALATIVDMIKSDSDWYNGVVEQAEKRNITLDECVLDNANYYLEFKRQSNLQKVK